MSDVDHEAVGLLPDGLYLVAVGPGGAVRAEVPEEGTLLVGRGEGADLWVRDPLVSRAHARLSAGPNGLAVEDLGSANGTYVGEERLPPSTAVPIRPMDVVRIGTTIMTVHQRLRGKAPLVWPHAVLESRLTEECANAAAKGETFGLVRLDIDGGASLPLAHEILAAKVRSGDLVAQLGPRQYHVLLIGSGAEQAAALVQQIATTLGQAHVSHRMALVMFPGDGASAQVLLAAAADKIFDGAGLGSPPVILLDDRMRALYAQAERVAVGTINVLITGETGVGKEVLAAHLHQRSRRADKPFVAVNCGALTETLLESELFGHERGAFTGAVSAKEGLFEAASGGTLFLDEVGETSLALQAKLLRILETKQLLRVGATKTRPVDVRIVAATNRDLEQEVEERRFREDLFFRLSAVTLTIPPLRERTAEIEALAHTFLTAIARQLGRPAPRLSGEALELLRRYTWPGNIRELRNTIERAVLLAEDVIGREHLPVEKMERSILRGAAAPGERTVASAGANPPEAGGLAWRDRLAQIEREAIADALSRCGGNKARAAELLGMPRTTLLSRIKEHGLG